MNDIEKVITAAKAGGAVLKNYFGQSLETTRKTTVADFKTKADLESEAAIIQSLTADFPDYNIYSEECGEIPKNSDYTFVIDPLDGTNNFVLGLSNFTVSISLLKDNELLLGVVYVPMIDNVFYAKKGKGAFVDGKPLHINSESDIKNVTVGYSCAYSTRFEEVDPFLHAIYKQGIKRVLINWSPAYDFCMFASGRIEGVICHDVDILDFGAGKLIAKEAGAHVTDFIGNPEEKDANRFFVMSNGTTIHKDFLDTVQFVKKL